MNEERSADRRLLLFGGLRVLHLKLSCRLHTERERVPRLAAALFGVTDWPPFVAADSWPAARLAQHERNMSVKVGPARTGLGSLRGFAAICSRARRRLGRRNTHKAAT